MHWPFAVLLAIALVLPPFFQNWEIVFLPFPWGGCGHGRRVGSAALSPPVTTGMLLDAGQDALRLAGSVESSARVTFAPGAARRAGATRRLMGARATERLGTAHLAARCLRSPWRPGARQQRGRSCESLSLRAAAPLARVRPRGALLWPQRLQTEPPACASSRMQGPLGGCGDTSCSKHRSLQPGGCGSPRPWRLLAPLRAGCAGP